MLGSWRLANLSIKHPPITCLCRVIINTLGLKRSNMIRRKTRTYGPKGRAVINTIWSHDLTVLSVQHSSMTVTMITSKTHFTTPRTHSTPQSLVGSSKGRACPVRWGHGCQTSYQAWAVTDIRNVLVSLLTWIREFHQNSLVEDGTHSWTVIWLEWQKQTFTCWCEPTLRCQMFSANIKKLDAICYTSSGSTSLGFNSLSLNGFITRRILMTLW